jgi:hypothetical protein
MNPKYREEAAFSLDDAVFLLEKEGYNSTPFRYFLTNYKSYYKKNQVKW